MVVVIVCVVSQRGEGGKKEKARGGCRGGGDGVLSLVKKDRERKQAKLEGKGEEKADEDAPSFFDRSCRRMPLASSSRFGFGPPSAVACLSCLAAARPLL